MSFVVNDLIQVLKLAVVLNSLGFVTFHFMLHGVEMAMLSLNIGTFGNTFVAELLCFHRLLVKKFLSSSDFVLETTTDSLFLVDLEFEILELAALVANVAALSVDNESGVVLVASLIIGEHPVAVLKRVDFVVDTLVVTLLVAKIVEILAELSNKLVFLTASDLDTGVMVVAHLVNG